MGAGRCYPMLFRWGLFSEAVPPPRPHPEGFILSEEDKSNPTALEYWFRRIDLDGDGIVSGFEVRSQFARWGAHRVRCCRPSPRPVPCHGQIAHFYSEQCDRMHALGQEPVLLADVICQLFDMVTPSQPKRGFSLQDLKRSAFCGRFFDMLFNLHKFLTWESKDPYSIREERLQPVLSDWDRFCRREYLRFALEDEGTTWTASDAAAAAAADDVALINGV